MNKDLEAILRLYTEGYQSFTEELVKRSKNNIIGMLTDLITIYINDLNSSTLREKLTLVFAGYEAYDGKLGYME